MRTARTTATSHDRQATDAGKAERLLAFCHIEKAAGTSLTHVLRRVFLLRYADVRPMHSRDSYFFTARDLRTALRINPFLRAIGGHSVVPHGDLLQSPVRLEFITQLREPIARATSQYRYWHNRGIDRSGADSFLAHQASRNFQVRKLAGSEDLERAKRVLLERFLLAGTADQFDAFLVLLARRLQAPLELFTYRPKNVDARPDRLPLPPHFTEELRRRNELDLQLYDWVKNELFPRYVADYDGDFSADLARFQRLQATAREPILKPAVDWLYRKTCVQPISGLIRLSNGLPYRGSYAPG